MSSEDLDYSAKDLQIDKELQDVEKSLEELYRKKEKKGDRLPEYKFEYYVIQAAKDSGLELDNYQRLFDAYYIHKKHQELTGIDKLWFSTERNLERFNKWLGEMDAFQVAEYLFKIIAIGSIIGGIWAFAAESAKRDEQRAIEAERGAIEAEQKEIAKRQLIYEAWQIMSSNEGKPANGGRAQALQVLREQNLNLEGINLENAIISTLNLSYANLPNAYFKGISAYRADFQDANLNGSDLRGAYLGEANLQFAELTSVALCPNSLTAEEPIHSRTRCNPPDNSTPVSGSVISAIPVPVDSETRSSCPWSKDRYEYADLTRSSLKDANLSRANLSCAILEGVNLSNAILSKTNLSFANLTSSILFEANLADSRNLDSATLKNALYNSSTKFPPSFDPKQAGAIRFEKGEYISNVTLRNINLTGENLGELRFKQVTLDNAVLNGADLVNAEFMGESSKPMKMGNLKLRGANLSGAKFVHVNLTQSDLRGARLEGADLDEAELCDVKLQGAIYNDETIFPTWTACTRGREIKKENFDPKNAGAYNILEIRQRRNIDLSGSNLSGLDLRNVDWRNVSLRGANLSRADLRGADLRRADLSNANLEGAWLVSAKLNDANLSGANLENASLMGSSLNYAILESANMKNTKLDGANLYYTNLSNTVDLSEQQVIAAKNISKTRFTGNLPEKLRCHYPLEWLIRTCIHP